MTPPQVVVKEQCYTRKRRKVRCPSIRQSIPRAGKTPSGWHGQRGGKGGTPESTYQHPKHLGYQPPVARDSGPVFEQLFLRPLDVVHHVFSVDIKRVSYMFTRLEGRRARPARRTCWRRCAESSRTVRSPWRRAAQSCGTCGLAVDLVVETECRAYMEPSSLMVDSMASMACPRWWMYVFWPSSIIWSCSCWSPPIGLSEMRSVAGAGVPLLGVP